MASKAPPVDLNRPRIYQIKVEGFLFFGSEEFWGLDISRSDEGDTQLVGPVSDQAALYGLLRRVRDLGARLISVNLVQSDMPDPQRHPKGEKND